jgi:tetratricopeptide (TPR) repeat protein
MPYRHWIGTALLALGLMVAARAQDTPAPAAKGKAAAGKATDVEMVEQLLAARRKYQQTLEKLRAHYIATGDIERARWAETELLHFHRVPKNAYRLELDVPPPNLQSNQNIPEANSLYIRAMAFKDKGLGNTYVDNQHRAELLLQQLLTNYPQSDKISDAAYQLGDIYESSAFKQYHRAAAYFERCFQWNPKTQLDARLRAARLYERSLSERNHALEIYKEITSHETDPKRIEEAYRKITELSGRK